ncbi:MAG: glycosyltransferase family 2 protein [Acidimicrobiales bacterium]
MPTVSIAIPVLNEERRLGSCLRAVAAQDYASVVEVLVVDGGSTDRTREVAARFDKVKILHNERRIRPAGLNVALQSASGKVFVRVDARTILAADYVSRSVAALEQSGATVVGGPLRFSASNARQRGIAAAMTSRLGAGPAAFRRQGGDPRFVDTVYLGVFWTEGLRELGGYDEVFGGNEDAELNHRASRAGGVWLDPSIISSYAVREGYRPLFSQYRRYGLARAGTMRKHPASISPRQLAVPLLVAGVASPWRKQVLVAYATAVLGRAAVEAITDPAAAPVMAAALPTMHFGWAAGLAEALVLRRDMTTHASK